MPPLKRRGPGRRADVAELSIDQRYHLETGMWFFGGFGTDLATFTEAWELHGETITADWIRDHPGTRPFAWWLLEHKQERPMIRTMPAEHLAAHRAEDDRRGCMFGFLHTSMLMMDPVKGWGYLQEPEPDYLRRHGLLTIDEQRALAGKDQ